MFQINFATQSVVDASVFVNSLIAEGQNNHRIIQIRIVCHVVPSANEDSAFGEVLFDSPDTQDLRNWIIDHAQGVKRNGFRISTIGEPFFGSLLRTRKENSSNSQLA